MGVNLNNAVFVSTYMNETAINEYLNGLLFVTRRRGWEGKLFLHNYRSVQQFETQLRTLGLYDVNTQPWQFSYDQVFGRKTGIEDLGNGRK